MRPLVILPGRYGDVAHCLPCVQHIAQHNGGKCDVMISDQFADILDGVSYANPVVVNLHFTDTNAMINLASGLGYECVLNSKVNERDIGVSTKCSSFTEEQWSQLGLLPLYDHLPLVFDRRDAERELKLFEQVAAQFNIRPEYPYGCFNFTGKSSPLGVGYGWLQTNMGKFAPVVQWVDLGQVKAERIYDLLILLERAEWLVTCDTATLHLAAACKVPCVNFIQCKPTRWHGSKPRNRSVLEMRYDEMRDLTEPLRVNDALCDGGTQSAELKP